MYRKTYQIPDRELAALRDLQMSYDDARRPPDGPLSSWIERNRLERNGALHVTVQERGQGWAVEIELNAVGDVEAVQPLSPERARKLDSH